MELKYFCRVYRLVRNKGCVSIFFEESVSYFFPRLLMARSNASLKYDEILFYI